HPLHHAGRRIRRQPRDRRHLHHRSAGGRVGSRLCACLCPETARHFRETCFRRDGSSVAPNFTIGIAGVGSDARIALKPFLPPARRAVAAADTRSCTTAPMTAEAVPADQRFAAFRHSAFLRYWASRFLTTFATQVVSVAVGWQIYDLTRDPF